MLAVLAKTVIERRVHMREEGGEEWDSEDEWEDESDEDE